MRPVTIAGLVGFVRPRITRSLAARSPVELFSFAQSFDLIRYVIATTEICLCDDVNFDKVNKDVFVRTCVGYNLGDGVINNIIKIIHLFLR